MRETDFEKSSPGHVAVMEQDHAEARHLEQIPIDLDDPHRAALEDNPEHAERPSLRTMLAVLSLAFSYVCPISCGFSLVTAILVQIGTELGDVENISWIVGGWSIASSISFSVAGKLSDIFGRRWTIIPGEVLCVVGSIVACTANTTLTLVAGSTILGFGMGIVFVSYAGIPELLPNKWRGTGIGLTELCLTIPWAVGGVLIATLLNTHTKAGWRWCYYIGIIYGVLSTIGTYLFYFPPERPQHDFEKTRMQEIKEIDFIGAFLYTAGLTIMLIGLTWAGTPAHPWKSASTIAPIIVGFFIIVACFTYDFTIAKQPFFPLPLFRQVREYTVLLIIVFIAGMVFYSMSGLLPQASLYIYTSDPIEIGIIALPNGCAQLVFGGIATCFMGKIGHLKLQVIVMLTVQTIAVACYSVAIPHRKSAWMAVQFFGMGAFQLVTSLAYIIAGLNTPLRFLGLASGLIGTFRSAGGSVGNAVFNTILHSVVTEQLPKQIAAAAISQGFSPDDLALLIPATVSNALGVPAAFAQVPGATPAVQAAVAEAFKQAYAYAFRRVFWATIPFGVIAIACACFIKDPSVYLTNHTAVHMIRDEHLVPGRGRGHGLGLDAEGTEKEKEKSPRHSE